MNILCRIGIHRWKIVQRYVAEGFPSSFYGMPWIDHYKYKGERCLCCKKWRNEKSLYWWQWLAILVLTSSVVVPTILFAGWLALMWLGIAIAAGAAILASIFALSM